MSKKENDHPRIYFAILYLLDNNLSYSKHAFNLFVMRMLHITVGVVHLGDISLVI